MSHPEVNTQAPNKAPRTLEAQVKQAREAAAAALIAVQRKAISNKLHGLQLGGAA